MTEVPRDAVADRYGARRSTALDRKLGWTLASVAVLVGAIVLTFGSWRQSTTEFQNISFELQNEATESGLYGASTKFEVSADPGARVSCAVEALNTSKATVAWKVVDLPPIETRSQTVTVNLVTIGPATAAHAKACWPVEG